MTEIVVRYEPERYFPWTVTVLPKNGWSAHATFLEARHMAKFRNGGTLPEVWSDEYGRIFPDRVRVWLGTSRRLWVERDGKSIGDPHGYPTHTAAMTAAHKLARGTK